MICANGNIRTLRNTIRSIQINYSMPCIAIVDKTIYKKDTDELKKLCPIYKGKETITSLINCGFKHSFPEWNILIYSGNWIRGGLNRKYSLFIEDEKDILYPIINRQHDFIDGSLSGLMIHRKMITQIDKFSEANPMDICKLMWALSAYEKGAKFKPILGVQIILN